MKHDRFYTGSALGDNKDNQTLELIIQGPVKALIWILGGCIGALSVWLWIWVIYFLVGGA
jgi:hypothetical protein